MKPETGVFMGIRNIGDSQDKGEINNGSLREMILWLAKLLAAMTMRKRIVVSIARNKEDCRLGLAVKGDQINDDWLNELNNLMGEQSESTEDDYVPQIKGN